MKHEDSQGNSAFTLKGSAVIYGGLFAVDLSATGAPVGSKSHRFKECVSDVFVFTFQRVMRSVSTRGLEGTEPEKIVKPGQLNVRVHNKCPFTFGHNVHAVLVSVQ